MPKDAEKDKYMLKSDSYMRIYMDLCINRNVKSYFFIGFLRTVVNI